MKRALVILILVILSGCGGGAAPAPSPPPTAVAAKPDTVARVATGLEGSLTITTAQGQEIPLEYCSDPINVGDVVELVPYGVGTTLVMINGLMVGSLIDWPATEEHIKNFGSEEDLKKEAAAMAAWEAWKQAHYKEVEDANAV